MKRISILMLLGVLLPAAWSIASPVAAAGTVTIKKMLHGTVTANPVTAEEGELVTLTVIPAYDYGLSKGSLQVERTTDDDGDNISYVPRRAPGVGNWIELTQTGTDTYTFIMPKNNVEVSAAFFPQAPFTLDVEATLASDAATRVNGMLMVVKPNEDGRSVSIVKVAQRNVPQNDIAVRVPSSVTDADGNSYDVTTIAKGAFGGLTSVTDIYLPDTDELLEIEEGSLTVDGYSDERHRRARIHTPLRYLDDYALKATLKDYYENRMVMATVGVSHRMWTFSCGVDVAVPYGIHTYRCVAVDGGRIAVELLVDQTIIQANNGVLMIGSGEGAQSYNMVAVPSSNRSSGMTPPEDNAQSYGKNMLVPVVKSCHYESGRCYIMKDNAFRPISQEDAEAMVPDCKAVLITD